MRRSALFDGLRRLRGKLAAQQHNDESDERLLQSFISRRDDNAFAVLVRRHGAMVLRVCRRVLGHEQDAEDAFQATFLVLARNAAALRNKTSLAAFLHGTAYRTALKAKQTAARRRKYEGRAPSRSPIDPADELSWREVRTKLDEEIARLPEKYQSVFVLCCLEEMSRAEAARRLGMKEGTLIKRLATARKWLRNRLARRGVELTAALAVPTLAMQSATALPAGLMATTLQAALATAAGEEWAGMVSASVAELVKGAAMATMRSNAQMVAVFVLAVGLLAGAGAWTYRAMMIPQPAEPQVEEPEPDQPGNAPWPRQNKIEGFTVKGRVLDPDGKAKAGAKLLLLDKSDTVKQIGVSAADGRFIAAIPKVAKVPYLIAQAEGAGIDFIHLAGANPEKPIDLRLVKDNPIRGRVANTEGKSIAGVRVAVKCLNVYANNSLDSFQRAWKKHFFISGMPGGVKGLRSEAAAWKATATAAVLLATMTDADGLFTLHGVGTERVALLRLSGAGIADNEVWVVNRAGFDAKPYNEEFRNVPKKRFDYEFIRLRSKRLVLHGPNISILAEPEKRIRGVVKDVDSGKGRPNAVVRLLINMKDEKGRYPIAVPIQTTTDAEGRYELRGALKAPSYLLEVPSDLSTGYIACQFRAGDSAGYEPLTANIRVKKGVIITGRMIERASGRPIPGFARVHTLINNPFAKGYPQFNSWSAAEEQEVAADGTFRVVAIPGPVLLVGGPATSAESKKYKQPSPDYANYPLYFPKEMKMSFRCVDGSIGGIQGNFCKVLEIKPGVGVVKQDIVLEPAKRSIWGIFK